MSKWGLVNSCNEPVHAIHTGGWQDLCTLVATHTVSDRKDGPGWVPGLHSVGKRIKDRAGPWDVMVLDIEAKTVNVTPGKEADGKRVAGPLPPTVEEISTELSLQGWSACIATSHSHEGKAVPDADHPSQTLGPRYRLVFEVSRPVQPTEIEPLGLYLAVLLGLSECLDHGCLESSRLFYLPRCPEARRSMAQSEKIKGIPLDVDLLLSQKRIADTPPTPRKATGTGTASVIDAFNKRADVAQILQANGYAMGGRKRWIYPNSSTGVAGVVQLPDTERVYSHHPSDPLYCKDHSHDAFSVYCTLEHGGDYRAAVKAAAADMGMGHTRPEAGALKRVDVSGIVGRVDPDTGEIEAPPAPLPIDDSSLSEGTQKLRTAIAAIPSSANLKRHTAERVIGMALRHVTSGIDEAVGRSLCFEWDTLTGGAALSVFESSDPNYSGQPLGLPSVFALARAHGWKEGEPWPEPTPLPDALPPVMAFDAELLPMALRGWVSDIAHRMQCPADFTAVAALVALSSLIGARAVIQPKARDDWQVVPNLWGVVVGRPGVMKSPALSEALGPLYRLEAKESEAHALAYAAWVLDGRVAEMQGAINEKKAKGLASKDPAAARALLERVDTPAEPIARRFIVNDATVEKLGELLQQNPWGTLSYRDEIHGLLTSLDKQGQEGARSFYLQSYDGNKGYTFDRIGRGTTHIPRVCLAMVGGIQPGKIQEYVRGAVEGGQCRRWPVTAFWSGSLARHCRRVHPYRSVARHTSQASRLGCI